MQKIIISLTLALASLLYLPRQADAWGYHYHSFYSGFGGFAPSFYPSMTTTRVHAHYGLLGGYHLRARSYTNFGWSYPSWHSRSYVSYRAPLVHYRRLYPAPWIISNNFYSNTCYAPAFPSLAPIYSTPLVSYSAYSPMVYTSPSYCPPAIVQPPLYIGDDLGACCSTTTPAASSYSGYEPEDTNAAPLLQTVPPASKIEIKHQPRYQIEENAEWLTMAVELIDQMVASGAISEAKASCDQLARVRAELPSEVTLRAGLLTLLDNSKPSDDKSHQAATEKAAAYFRLATQNGTRQITTAQLSPQFLNAVVSQSPSIAAAIENASKTLLDSANPNNSQTVLVSTQSTIRLENTLQLQRTNRTDDARVIIDTLLRVQNKDDMAERISQALDK